MKRFLEYVLKSLPILVIAILTYFLFVSPDSNLHEGMKLSLSALLGAIASYVFIQYSEFLKKIDIRKSTHRKALSSLEFKLNDQLNWLADVDFQLSEHQPIIEKILAGQVSMAYDASIYREPVSIEKEIYYINNLKYKNQLLSLHTDYKKLENDLNSMQTAYRFMLEQAISIPEFQDSYFSGLPHHLANVKRLHSYTKQYIGKTRDALSVCRVLIRDSRNLISNVNRYFIIHSDPDDFAKQVADERKKLDGEIKAIGEKSQKEIDEVENKVKV